MLLSGLVQLYPQEVEIKEIIAETGDSPVLVQPSMSKVN